MRHKRLFTLHLLGWIVIPLTLLTANAVYYPDRWQLNMVLISILVPLPIVHCLNWLCSSNWIVRLMMAVTGFVASLACVVGMVVFFNEISFSELFLYSRRALVISTVVFTCIAGFFAWCADRATAQYLHLLNDEEESQQQDCDHHFR